MNVAETSEQGFAALSIDDGVVGCTVVPDLGGKLTSIRRLDTGREWLWRSDRLADRRHPYGASYVGEADTGGWDECFPTVASSRVPRGAHAGIELPDHGELWCQAWDTEVERGDGAAWVRSRVHGVQLSYDFERTIALHADGGSIRFDYGVTSTGDHELDFIWSAHPLFPVEPGGAVRLPPGTRLHTYSAVDGTEPPAAEPFAFPFTVSGVDVTTLPPCDAGIALKVWSDPLDEGWAELVGADGAVLRMTWDPAEIPQVGLWLNAGGWSGIGGAPYCNLALEPCIGAQDSLEEAVLVHDSFATLGPGETQRWSLEVALT